MTNHDTANHCALCRMLARPLRSARLPTTRESLAPVREWQREQARHARELHALRVRQGKALARLRRRGDV